MTPKILMVDDDPLMHQLYEHHIARAGYQAIGATNGREAIEVAVSEQPQVIVMDFMMPEMDGLTAVSELKRTEATRPIAVIMISDNSKYHLWKKGAESVGANVFLTKPFSPAQLMAQINRILQGNNPQSGTPEPIDPTR